jgi:FKBP-type peptidyl-prolyl cis-trans isomerase FkpA
MYLAKTSITKLSALFFAGLMLLFSGCFDDDEKEAAARLQSDLATIDQYLGDQAIEALSDERNRIRYVIHTQGNGIQPSLDSSCISTKYTGRFLESGEQFTHTDRSSYSLRTDLLEGLKIALPLLHQGDVVTIYIPSGLAYGPTGLPMQNIPPDVIVYFDLELLYVGTKYTAAPEPAGSCN